MQGTIGFVVMSGELYLTPGQGWFKYDGVENAPVHTEEEIEHDILMSEGWTSFAKFAKRARRDGKITVLMYDSSVYFPAYTIEVWKKARDAARAEARVYPPRR